MNKEDGDGYSSGEDGDVEFDRNVEFDREMADKFFAKGFTKAYNDNKKGKWFAGRGGNAGAGRRGAYEKILATLKRIFSEIPSGSLVGIITYSDAGVIQVHEIGFGLNFTHTQNHHHSEHAQDMGKLNWSKYSNTAGGAAYVNHELIRNRDGLVIGKRVPYSFEHGNKYKALAIKKFYAFSHDQENLFRINHDQKSLGTTFYYNSIKKNAIKINDFKFNCSYGGGT